MGPTYLVFLVAWISYGFELFRVSGVSVTAALLGGVGGYLLLLLPVRRLALLGWIAMIGSAMVGVAVGLVRDAGIIRLGTHAGQSAIALGFLILGARVGSPSRRTVRWVVVPAAAIVIAFALYQVPARALDLPGAWLPITNEQISGDEGFQRGFTRAMEGDTFARASSLFPEPSDLGRFSAWLALLGLLGSFLTASTRTVLVCLGVLGVVLSQSVGGLIALAAAVALAALWGSRRVSLAGAIVRGVGLAAALVFAAYVAAEFEVLTPLLERLAGIARGDTVLTRTQRFADLAVVTAAAVQNPVLGLGLGAVGDLPGSPLVSIGYLVLVIERGLVGGLLFITPLVYVGVVGIRGRAHTGGLGFAAIWCVLELVFLINFAMIYFPTAYFAAGAGLREVSNHRRAARASR